MENFENEGYYILKTFWSVLIRYKAWNLCISTPTFFEKLVGCKVFCALHSKNIIVCLTDMDRVLGHACFRMNDSRGRLDCAQMQNSVLLSLINSLDQYRFFFVAFFHFMLCVLRTLLYAWQIWTECWDTRVFGWMIVEVDWTVHRCKTLCFCL